MMKSSKPTLNKSAQRKVVQMNKEELVAVKAAAATKKPTLIKQPEKTKVTFGEADQLKSMKGQTCAVFPFSEDELFYGEFSKINRVSFSRPSARTLLYESTNWIFDLAVDFKGRLVMAEGFGFVRVVANKKETFTLEERVHCCMSH